MNLGSQGRDRCGREWSVEPVLVWLGLQSWNGAAAKERNGGDGSGGDGSGLAMQSGTGSAGTGWAVLGVTGRGLAVVESPGKARFGTERQSRSGWATLVKARNVAAVGVWLGMSGQGA